MRDIKSSKWDRGTVHLGEYVCYRSYWEEDGWGVEGVYLWRVTRTVIASREVSMSSKGGDDFIIACR